MIYYHLSSGSGGMADALDSGSSGSYPVRVQVPFSALKDAEKARRVIYFTVWAFLRSEGL